jgi:hypothetical protein
MIIGISGKARSGKDTFAEMLAKELQKKTGNAYVLMAYAHELKLRVQKDFDMSYEQLWGSEKEVQDKRYPKADEGGFMTTSDANAYWTPREILQAYGQFFRTINYNFWVDYLFRVVEEKEYKNILVTDLRHINEVDAVVDRGGYHIRVERDDKDTVHNEQHISETALDNGHRVDFTVVNNFTLEHLEFGAGEVADFLIEIEKRRKSDG